MPELIFHAQTARQLENLVARPAHAILLLGPPGTGKTAAAQYLAAQLLGIERQALAGHPYVRVTGPVDGKAIGIEVVRDLEHFLSLKIPGGRSVARIALVQDAHLLTQEAQNALLKTLEEPPTDTVLLLTAAHEQQLLPTIRSRLQTVNIKRPPLMLLREHFAGSVPAKELEQALVISGGLPGLTTALLQNDAEHPLMQAVQASRRLLQGSAYDRLLQVDALAKQKELSRDVCFVLMQMARMALARGGAGQQRWLRVLTAAYRAEEQLRANAQSKLALANLMLSL